MRLWSLHPQYLDSRGLVALWREALLAQAVLRGRTVGYRNHPQLLRFSQSQAPRASIAAYLRAVFEESQRRGYHFDARKLARFGEIEPLSVSRGQLQYEWQHLRRKLEQRDPAWLAQLPPFTQPRPHPSFRSVAGAIAPWERIEPPRRAGS